MADDFAAALRAEKVGERSSDGTWTCECGGKFLTDLDLYMHRRHAATHQRCSLCDGRGCENGCGRDGGCEDAHSGPASHKVCSKCRGSGKES